MNIFALSLSLCAHTLTCMQIFSESFEDKLHTSYPFASKAFSEYLTPEDEDMLCVIQGSGQLQDANIEASRGLPQALLSVSLDSVVPREQAFLPPAPSPAQDHICEVTFDQIKILFFSFSNMMFRYLLPMIDFYLHLV